MTEAAAKKDQAKDQKKGKRKLPVLQGILPLNPSGISGDMLAGITLAALGIPEVMGYAKIAGVPVIAGLYTILVPIAIFALFGSSRHLVVGADSASAAMMAAGLAGLAASGSADYLALAGIVAILTGAFLLLARIIRLGFLADFLSRSVLIGFLTGVGIQVAMGQLPGMLGVTGGTGGTLSKFWGTLEQIPKTSLTTLAVTVSVVVVIEGMKLITKKVPGALIAVVGSIAVSEIWNLQAHGVAILGPVPGGLPKFGVPSYGWNQWLTLVPVAASIFLVVLAQSAATSRAYAAKYGDHFNENIDLVGLSLSSVAAGLSATFVVNGSPTKTQMVDSAGGKSQIAQLTTSFIVLIVLLFLTKPLQYLPEAVLATIVFLIGVELVDIKGMRKIFRLRMDEFIVAAVTAAVVVAIGVEQGILLAIALSIVDHLRRSYHPRNIVVVTTDKGELNSLPIRKAEISGNVEAVPGLVIYRFAASIYYANSNLFTEEVRAILKSDKGTPKWFCLDAEGVDDVDYSAGETLQSLIEEVRAAGARFVIAHADEDVKALLDRYGITEQLGEGAYFDTAMDVIGAFRTANA